MKFMKKLNEGMIVEWQPQYLNFAKLRGFLTENERLRNELNELQHEVEDMVIEMSGNDEHDTSQTLSESIEVSPASPASIPMDVEIEMSEQPTETTETNGEVNQYTILSERIDQLEIEFWKEINANMEKIDIFLCDKLKFSCDYLNKYKDRLLQFNIISKHDSHLDIEPIEREINKHELVGIKKVDFYDKNINNRPTQNRNTVRYSIKDLEDLLDESNFAQEVSGFVEPTTTTKLRRRHSLETVSVQPNNNEKSSTEERSEGEVSNEEQDEDRMDTDSKGKSEISRKKRNKLRGAGLEFYRGLVLLQNYCTLNIEAFAKILKKNDKVNDYRKTDAVNECLATTKFYKMEELKSLITMTENLISIAFHDKRAFRGLSINAAPVSQPRTIRLGVLTGISTTLFIIFLFSLSGYIYQMNGDLLSSTKRLTSEEVVSLLFIARALLLPSLLQIAWGIDMFIYRIARINDFFIFDFDRTTFDVFRVLESGLVQLTAILCTCILTLATLSPPSGLSFFGSIPYWIFPLINVTLAAIIFSFRNVRRRWLPKTLLRIFMAPTRKVYFKDFWMADQLTSITPVFSDIIFTIGYFIWGIVVFESIEFEFEGVQLLSYRKYFVPVISCGPYISRFLQCLRSARDSGNKYQIANAGKYMFSILKVITGGIKDVYTVVTIPLWIVIGIASSTYSLVWDIVMDWGLARKKHYFLRKKKLYPIWAYPISICIDSILRFTMFVNVAIWFIDWFDDHLVVKELISVFLSTVEVFRRGHWNIYRVEFEQTSNMDKFRATKEIPLPLPD
ncbi:Uncharacterized protein QTN25_002493 [Entamoeba marina]